MSGNTFAYVIFSIVVVLALIAGVAWAVRRFASDRLGGHGHRGRMPRLAVIDAAPVDSRRKLVLIRRDNVEHLLMIGGPSDIVVEPNIIRAQPVAREQGPRGPGGMDAAGRPSAETSSWQDLDAAAAEMRMHDEPGLTPEVAPRPARAPHGEDMPRRAPPAMPPISQPSFERRPPERRPDPITEFSPEPLREQRQDSRVEARVEPRVEPRPEPRPAPAGRMFRQQPPAEAPPRAARAAEPPRPAPPREQPSTSADQNLAEMAQRLEAALRRSGAEPKPDAGVSVSPVDRVGAPSVAPDSAPPRAPAPPARPAPAPAKSEFESLEDEMASLLGRSKNPP